MKNKSATHLMSPPIECVGCGCLGTRLGLVHLLALLLSLFASKLKNINPSLFFTKNDIINRKNEISRKRMAHQGCENRFGKELIDPSIASALLSFAVLFELRCGAFDFLRYFFGKVSITSIKTKAI